MYKNAPKNYTETHKVKSGIKPVLKNQKGGLFSMMSSVKASELRSLVEMTVQTKNN